MEKQKKPESVTIEQTLTGADCAEAAAAAKYYAKPLQRNSILAALCLTAAAVAGSLIYTAYVTHPRWTWVPVATCAAMAVLSAFFFFVMPKAERRRAEKWFSSSPLAALPAKVTVSGDRVVLESECEKITEYFTDFTLCAETDRVIAAIGGRQRYLLIVKKDGLSPGDAEKLSQLFRYAFDGRWYRMPPGKGVSR